MQVLDVAGFSFQKNISFRKAFKNPRNFGFEMLLLSQVK
jgi:hypothetical protein